MAATGQDAAVPLATIEVWLLDAEAAPAALARLSGRTEPLPRTPSGKPYLPGGPEVNLSHSGGYALLASCADTPVGVDLEAPRRMRNPDGLSRRMGTGAEQRWLADLPEPRRHRALLWLWTRKEAVAKAEGGGLLTALSGLDVLGPLVHTEHGAFFVHSLTLPLPGFSAAVAWRA